MHFWAAFWCHSRATPPCFWFFSLRQKCHLSSHEYCNVTEINLFSPVTGWVTWCDFMFFRFRVQVLINGVQWGRNSLQIVREFECHNVLWILPISWKAGKNGMRERGRERGFKVHVRWASMWFCWAMQVSSWYDELSLEWWNCDNLLMETDTFFWRFSWTCFVDSEIGNHPSLLQPLPPSSLLLLALKCPKFVFS